MAHDDDGLLVAERARPLEDVVREAEETEILEPGGEADLLAAGSVPAKRAGEQLGVAGDARGMGQEGAVTGREGGSEGAVQQAVQPRDGVGEPAVQELGGGEDVLERRGDARGQREEIVRPSLIQRHDGAGCGGSRWISRCGGLRGGVRLLVRVH